MRVEFPGATIPSTAEVRTPNGAHLIETRTLNVPGVGGTMVASCARVGLTDHGLSSLLDFTRDALLNGTGATLVEERTSIGGRELRFSLQGHEIRARFVVMGGKLLTLVVAPVDAFDERSVVRFLESPRSLAGLGAMGTPQQPD
jgi:hypothetical protein